MSGVLQLLNPVVPAAGVTYATWNPADKGALTTLSNGNLTAAFSAANGIRATLHKTSGSWYFEVTTGSVFPSNFLIGVVPSGASLASGPPSSGVVISAAGVVYKNGVASGNAGSGFTSRSYIGLLFSPGSSIVLLWGGTNQGGVSDSFTVPADAYPYIGALSSLSGQSFTANFGASALNYTPSGGNNAGVFQ